MEQKVICHEIGKDPLYKIWHAADEHLIMYIYSGGGSIVSGKHIFPLKKGVLLFVAADTYHYTMPEDPTVYDRSKLIISTQTLVKIAELLRDNAIFKNIFDKTIVYAEIEESEQGEVDRIFTELMDCKTEESEEIVLLSCLLRLMLFLDKYMVESISVATGFMYKAIKFINENISTDIDIDDICSAVNISKYHFCRQFKKQTGMTVMKYVLKTRIVLSKIDLKTTTFSVTEISERYGFSSVSYFSRIFKEYENCSPLQYRKRNQNKI